jgi:FkbM family methyltransferase
MRWQSLIKMKALIRRLYQLIPFKIFIFRIIRAVWLPPHTIWQHFYFSGKFPFYYNGKKLWMYNQNTSFETSVFWQGYINEEKTSVHYWSILCRYSDVIVDIGANSGYYAIIAKALNPKAHVIAFEPVDRIFSTLKKNVAANHFNITCIQAAISNHTGTALLYDYPEQHHYQASLNKESMSRKNDVISYEVPVMRLDDYAANNNITRIDLIKIDVEGHEAAVFEGALKILQQSTPSILFEVKEEAHAARIQEMINGLGYSFYNIDEANGLIPVSAIERSHHWNFLLLNARHQALINL